MYKNGKVIGIALIGILCFSVFSTFSYALAIDNNCPTNVIHILQVTPALLCLESRIDVIENTPVSAGSGEANTASNLGSIGEGWFNSKVGVDLQFKKAVAGTGITLQSNGTRVMINSTGGSGEANTISCDSFTNGQCIVSGKVGVDLQLKNVVSANSKVSITSNSSHIIFTDNVTGESTVCSNATSSAGHFGLCKDNLITLRTLKASTGISLSLNSTDVIISNTGIISNSCSNGITCSGTNPSTFTVKMELLCQQTLGSTNSTIMCSFSARKHLFITMEIRITGGTGVEPAYRFNDDSGSNYAFRLSGNGGADSTVVSTTRCNIGTGGILRVSGDGGLEEMWVYNNQAGDRKLAIGQAVLGLSSTVATAPDKVENSCKWGNTANQITKITMIVQSGTGSYNTGSILTVWGYD